LVSLRTRLTGKRCGVFNFDLRVRNADNRFYTYPDIAIVCSEPQFGPSHTLTNPVVLVEVLSASTEAHDRGLKFERYQHIDSLREYVLISQERPRVETFSRQTDGSWRYLSVEGLESVVSIASVGVEVPLAEIYDGVMFLEWLKASSGTER
jgi:Uma2 family endonuclease